MIGIDTKHPPTHTQSHTLIQLAVSPLVKQGFIPVSWWLLRHNESMFVSLYSKYCCKYLPSKQELVWQKTEGNMLLNMKPVLEPMVKGCYTWSLILN